MKHYLLIVKLKAELYVFTSIFSKFKISVILAEIFIARQKNFSLSDCKRSDFFRKNKDHNKFFF